MPLNNNVPCWLNKITFEAYQNEKSTSFGKMWFSIQPKTLRLIVLDKIVENWPLPKKKDRIYLLDNLCFNTSLKLFCTHIDDNIFWEKYFKLIWSKDFIGIPKNKLWKSLFIEKYLANIIEEMSPKNYNQNEFKSELDMCAPFVQELKIDYLQPSFDFENHIPFEFILSSLRELQVFYITYAARKVETNFYKGCTSPSQKDLTSLYRGLEKCYNLLEFKFYGTPLESQALKYIAKALDKGCPKLKKLTFRDCRFGDKGLEQFFCCLSANSFNNIREIIITNNHLTEVSAFLLSKAIERRPIQNLDLRLNPIGAEGAAVILKYLNKTPLRVLNLSSCSITDMISTVLLRFIVEHRTLEELNLSNNILGMEFSLNITRVIEYNVALKKLHLSETDVSEIFIKKINEFLKNRQSIVYKSK